MHNKDLVLLDKVLNYSQDVETRLKYRPVIERLTHFSLVEVVPKIINYILEATVPTELEKHTVTVLINF